MFIRVVKRKLRDDTALDIKLLESYRPAPGQPPKHKFIKQWTIRQSDVIWDKDGFLDDVERDLDYMDMTAAEQKKVLAGVKKALNRAEKKGL